MRAVAVREHLLLEICIFLSLQHLIRASTHTPDGESNTCLDRESSGGVALLATQALRHRAGSPTAPLPVIPTLLQTEKMSEYVPEHSKDEPNSTASPGIDAQHSQTHDERMPPLVEDAHNANEDGAQNVDGPSANTSSGEANEALNETLDSIIEEVAEPVEKKHVIARYVVAPLSFAFFAVFTIANIMEKLGIVWLPESAVLIFFGGLLSVFCTMIAKIELSDEVFSHMMPKMLNLILLPILMFGSGWTLRRQDFFSQFPHILLFAFVGVALSTLVIGGLIYVTGSLGFHGVTTIRTAFVYATLISATDPVATMSTYSKLKVHPLLNIMVFGESIINDAVAIVFFNVLNSDHFMLNTQGQTMTGMQLGGSILWGIAKIFFGSVIIGAGLGVFYTLIAKWADMKENKNYQILVILASCYLTYALAESASMSGIIATMFSGVMMGIYMKPHLSTEGSLLATFFVSQLSSLADAGVFLLVGFSVMQLTTTGWFFGLWVMLFCLIGRAASVYPVAFTVNQLKTALGSINEIPEEGWNLLTYSHMFMMWHAGLRGGIALALSLELGQWVDIDDGAGTRRTLQTATFLLIVTFLVVFGGSTTFFLKALGIPMEDEAPEGGWPADTLSKTEGMGRLNKLLHVIDHQYLSPWLLGDKGNDKPIDDEIDVIEYLKNARDGNRA